MRQLACVALSLLVASCASTPVPPPSDPDPAIAGAIAQIGASGDRNPDLPQLKYLLATYYDRAADAAGVLGTLEQLERNGWRYGIAREDFPNTKTDAFATIAARLNGIEPKVSASREAFVLPELGLTAEGIAADAADGSLYVGSIHRRKIVRIAPDGTVSDFTRPGDTLAVLGIKVDEPRRLLWAATWASESMRGYGPELKGRAALVALDLRTGVVARTVTTGSAGATSLLNDLAILEDGTILVTDSERGSLLRLDPTATEFEVVTKGFQYPNGIVAWKTGHVLIDDFVGLWRIDLASGERTRLSGPDGVLLSGIDGMVLDGTSLIAVQNGVGRPRILRIMLNDDATAVTGVSTLENAHAALEIPTTATILGRDLYYIANAQLRAFEADQSIWPEERLRPTVILRLRLP